MKRKIWMIAMGMLAVGLAMGTPRPVAAASCSASSRLMCQAPRSACYSADDCCIAHCYDGICP